MSEVEYSQEKPCRLSDRKRVEKIGTIYRTEKFHNVPFGAAKVLFFYDLPCLISRDLFSHDLGSVSC